MCGGAVKIGRLRFFSLSGHPNLTCPTSAPAPREPDDRRRADPGDGFCRPPAGQALDIAHVRLAVVRTLRRYPERVAFTSDTGRLTYAGALDLIGGGPVAAWLGEVVAWCYVRLDSGVRPPRGCRLAGSRSLLSRSRRCWSAGIAAASAAA
jgi:hypothetical protein